MLKVNDIVIDLVNPSEAAKPYVKRIKDQLDELYRRTRGIVELTMTDIHSQMTETDKGDRYVQWAEGVGIPAQETIYVNGNAEIWTWYERMKKVGMDEKYEPRRYKFTDKGRRFDMNASTIDKGLLYFLVFVSPHCDKVPVLRDMQNPAIKQADYRIVMSELEAADKVELNKKISQINDYIYNKLKLEDLRTLAAAWGVPNTATMYDNQLMLKLSELITTDVDRIDKFMQDMNVNPGTELKAHVNLAIEHGLILLDKRGKKTWRYKADPEKGQKTQYSGDQLISPPAGKDEVDSLVEWYKTHPSEYEVLQAKLQTM